MLSPTYLLDKTLLNTIFVSLDINSRKKTLLGAVSRFMCVWILSRDGLSAKTKELRLLLSKCLHFLLRVAAVKAKPVYQ